MQPLHAWDIYTPQQTGTYSFIFQFPWTSQLVYTTQQLGIPGDASDYVNDTYLASSASTTLTVTNRPSTVISNLSTSNQLSGLAQSKVRTLHGQA